MSPKIALISGEGDPLIEEVGSALRRIEEGRLLRVSSDRARIPEDLAEAEAVVAPAEAVPARQIAAAGRLRFLQLLSCDPHPIDTAALESRGVTVAGIGAALATSAAHHCVRLMDEVAGSAREGSPARAGGSAYAGKTVGIVGLGRVGLEVARTVRGEAGRLRYMDVRTPPRGATEALGLRRLTMDRLLVESDVLSVHVPLTPQTRASFDLRELSIMRHDAMLILGSRPEVVSAEALSQACQRDLIRGAGLTYEDPELSHLDRVVADPYPALDHAARRAIAELVGDNLRRFFAGRSVRSVLESVTFPRAGDPSFWSSRMAPRAAEEESSG